jgi:competence protein ComEC
VNPGTQDTERILFHDGIHALGTVLDASINHRIDSGHRPLDALRERIANHIDSRVADRDAAALISALAVGVTGSMSREQWRVFNVTGTTHLVAISGLHVTLFAVVAFAAARALWSLLLYRFVPWQRENFAALVGFLAAAGYAALAGLSVPTQRTLIMLGVWLFTRSIARASTPFHSFVLALFAVLLFDPFAPLTPGFWLSFIAMAAIILLTSTRFARRPLLIEALAVQTVVTIALVPVTLAAFGSVSLIGPVVNLAAIPAMSWIFVPTILLSVLLAPVMPGASDRVLDLAAWMHDVAWPWLAAAADLPWALVHASPPVWWYVLASIGVFLSLMPWPLTLRLAAVVWVFPLAMAVDSHPGEGVAEITALDVGKGTSVVVQTKQHVLVYEVGDAYGTDGRIAESILVPFLRSRGVRRIDVLVLNRLTAANGPGVTALLAEMPVDQTLVGGAAGMDLPGARPCPCDEAWDWDGVRFAGSSAGACMIRVESSGARGVLSPSTTEFVRTDGAHWAVVPGRRERNGREKPAVRRSREGGATVLSTGDLGAIHFRLAPDASLQGPAAARLDSHAPWRLPSTGPAALRYDAAHPKVPWLDGKNVGNRAGRRTPDVADHSLFHRRRSDHSRTALDASGQTRPAPRADAEGVAAHRIQSGE